MKSLPVLNPTTAEMFKAGKFTIQRSSRVFSATAIDHTHEQNNKWLKGDGGVIGLTENTASLNKWMLAGPEIARCISEFESNRGITKVDKTSHHEQSRASKRRFQRNVDALHQHVMHQHQM